jgi:hypothetical protein
MVVTIIVIAVIAILAGAGDWWFNSELAIQGKSLAKLPVLSQSMAAFSSGLNDAQVRLSQMPDALAALTNRIDSVEKRMTASLQAARRQSQEAVTQVSTKLESKFEQRFGNLDKRVNDLQTQHELDSERVASLNAQLTALRSEMKSQIAEVRQSMPSDAQPEIAELRAGLARNGEHIATISNRLERQHVGFEVPQDRESEVSPGLFLTVKHANVQKQQIDGWLYVKDERRTLWLANEGVLKPITVYGTGDQPTREVVITRVTSSGAVGYVVLPKEGNPVAENR